MREKQIVFKARSAFERRWNSNSSDALCLTAVWDTFFRDISLLENYFYGHFIRLRIFVHFRMICIYFYSNSTFSWAGEECSKCRSSNWYLCDSFSRNRKYFYSLKDLLIFICFWCLATLNWQHASHFAKFIAFRRLMHSRSKNRFQCLGQSAQIQVRCRLKSFVYFSFLGRHHFGAEMHRHKNCLQFSSLIQNEWNISQTSCGV
jgi:hypothetical protein